MTTQRLSRKIIWVFPILALAAIIAISLATAGQINANNHSANHDISFNKGCVGPINVGDPNTCTYGVFNFVVVDTGPDTLTITSIVDVVHADPSDVSSGNILSSLTLNFTDGGNGISFCNGGQTLCTLPPGSTIQSDPFTFYSVDATDPSPLIDDAVLTWQDTCDSGAVNCPTGDQTSTTGSQVDILTTPVVLV